MKLFLHAHASHPQWQVALSLVTAQLEAQRADPVCASEPTLGWVYLTDHYAPHAQALLDALRQRWAGVAWVGCVGIGVCGNGVEYFDEPALSVMLAELPREQFRLWSGVQSLGSFDAAVAQVHADPETADLGELIGEMADRTAGSYLFGGLAASRGRALHFADGVYAGGLSGVGFAGEVSLLSRVTQGCQPVGPVRQVTDAERNVVIALDGRAGARLPAGRSADRIDGAAERTAASCGRRWSA